MLADPPPVSGAAPRLALATEPRPSRPRVLVVDDEDAVRRVLARTLTQAGYLVDTTPDGRGALEALRHDPYDAVLSDISMPDMDGIELLRAIRQNQFDVP